MASVGFAACGSSSDGPVRRVSASGSTVGISSDGDGHVAYLLGASPTFGSKGELHVASADGKDVKVATGISVGGYAVSPNGKALLFAQSNAAGDDASLNWVDLSQPSMTPKVLFATGLQTQPVVAGTSSPTMTMPLTGESFFTPSGRYFVVGVLAPNVAVSPDLHVIDVNTGSDVFTRPNGAFDYLEVALPDDTMIFQDSVGGNDGASGAPPVQTLFWVSLSGGAQATPIDTRTGSITISGDNKTVAYQKVDRTLWVWDVVSHPATGTKLASSALNFAIGDSGPVAYIGADKSVHVVGLDGKALLDVAGATAAADLMSPVILASDGADVYYFQAVSTQDARGTLMHVSVTAGATPTKIADSASIYDVHPVPGGLLFMQNVDGVGEFGDAVRSARDGSGPTALGTKVPVGTLSVILPKGGGTSWVAPHLTGATTDKNQKLLDGATATVGALALTSSAGGGDAAIDPSVRIGQFAVSPDLLSLVWIGGVAFDTASGNYVGSLHSADVATPTMAGAALVTGASEIGPVVNRSLFVNAPKASTPGVYFVKY